MKKEDKKLVFAFVTLLIIILATFAVTTYYYDTKYISKAAEEALFAKAFVDENVGAVPLDVNFSALLFNFEGTPTYHWEFGDGNTSNEMNPTHNYTKEGEYTCNLTVIDITGKIVTTSVKILVVANTAPTVVALVGRTASPRPNRPLWLIQLNKIPIIGNQLLAALAGSDSPLTKEEGWITCEAQVSDPEGDEIILYEWEIQQPPVAAITGKQEWPKFTFLGENLTTMTFPLICTFRTGQYDVKVTVTDVAGNKASDIKRFNIGNSNLENQIWALKRTWYGFWGPNFAFQPEPLQKILLKIWNILGPIQTTMDNMVEKILAPLPPNIRDPIYTLYYTLVWEQKEKDYHKPNFNAPDDPSDPFPADNATDVDLNADLNWTCSDPDGHPLKYDIYFGTTSPPPFVISGHSATNFTLGPLLPNTTYYWKIVAKDLPRTGGSKTTDGPVWSFTTGTV